MLAAYRAEPAAGVHTLVLEHIAVSLNPRQGLAAGERLSSLLAATSQHRDVLSAFAARLDRMPWRVYEVRRVIRPRAGDPTRAANASRSLRAVAAGIRAPMAAVLRKMAEAEGAGVDDEDGIERALLTDTRMGTCANFVIVVTRGEGLRVCLFSELQDKAPGQQPVLSRQRNTSTARNWSWQVDEDATEA